jgi:heme-degrading monooxygenase HmoA
MLENQWDQGLGLQGFEFFKLERSEEKEGEELVGVSRWEELCRA